jgi:hypothetical protein
MRARLRSSHGFCREHSLMAIDVCRERGLASGLAIMYEDFLRHVSAEVAEADTATRRRTRKGSDSLAPHRACIACESADAAAVNYLRIFAMAKEDSEPVVAIRESGHYLCLAHLRRGLEVTSSQEQVSRLTRIFRESTALLEDDLRGFVRKHDYRFHEEVMTPEEIRSWTAAVFAMIGERSPGRSPGGEPDERPGRDDPAQPPRRRGGPP